MGIFAARMVKRFGLSAEETDFIERLEAHPVRYAKGETVVSAGDPADQAFVLITGWVMSYSRFTDGSYQVRRLHFPGDLLGMPSVALRHHVADIETLSDALISPFPKRLLADLFSLPRLTAIMYMFAQAERITAGDRLCALGRISAKGRIAFLLLDVLHRLRSVDESITSSFHLHLTREQVAQVTGMTPVHASRMWSELINEGSIASEGHFVTILRKDELLRLSEFCEHDKDFDTDWLSIVEQQAALHGGDTAR